MTAQDMHDLFRPGTEVDIVCTNGQSIVATLRGWRENGIVVDDGVFCSFFPFTNILAINVDSPRPTDTTTERELTHA
jgi:hypothetical protein